MLLEFVYGNIKYPATARESGCEGLVVISFEVAKDGWPENARIVRDPGCKLGEEALRVVRLMKARGKRWTPGQSAGRNVRVQFSLPVKFRLE